MPFEARKANFTVFSLNHELCNLIKSAFNMKLESTSTRTYRCRKLRRRADQVQLSKTCIVLNGLNKSFLHRESIELQTNQAIIMSWRTLSMLSLRKLSPGSHANKFLPRQRITDSSDSQLGQDKTRKFCSQSALDPNDLHCARRHVLLANSNVPDVLAFCRARECHIQIFNRRLQPNQSSEYKITPTAARNVQSIARLSPKLVWLKIFAV